VAVTRDAMNENSASRKTSQVVLLGTGTPNADPERSGPAIAVVVNQTPYLVDFGPGVIRRAAAACQMGVAGLDVQGLNRAFVTHLHSDHTAGYPDLILTPWVLGRDEPLEVYGPAGIRTMTDHVTAAYRQDIAERLQGLESANDRGWRVNVTEIEAGVIYEDSNVAVEAFPVRHGSWPAFGYRFLTPDRAIVVSGDTAPAESILEKSQDSEVLIHEVYAVAGFQTLPPTWQRYHSSVHTSSRELALIASRARPGLLILYHQLLWGTTDEHLLLEIREGYDGMVVSGRDLDIY
jgi:ribonuclease BN (tRNA processing enzyme)